MKKIAAGGAVVAMAAALVSTGTAAQDQQFVTIGTGAVTGVYYPTGGAIQRLVNAGRGEHGVRVSVEATGGSVFNLNAIAQGELHMGVVQSDQQYNAYNGVAPFADAGPNQDLRAVFSLHGEPFTVVARADSGIETFEDLKGKRVNVGNPGSGQRATMEVLMEAYGWTMRDFAQVSELQAAEQSQALCDNNVDAIVYTVGHPNGSIQEATSTCATTLVAVDGAPVQELVEQNPYYAFTTIPGGMYEGNPDDVTTFGPKATLVTSTDVPEDVVYAVTKAVFDNLEDFKRLHPAFQTLEKEAMVSDGLSAPLHDGAKRFYDEAGLIEE